MHHQFRPLPTILACVILSGCVSTIPLPHAGVSPPNRAPGTWRPVFPREFTASQRIVLKTGGREFDFLGIIAVRTPGECRARAMGEMGGTFFDFLYADSVFHILTRPDRFPVSPLRDGVCGDLLHLYGLYKGDPVPADSGGTAWIRKLDDALSEVFLFDSAAVRPSRSLMFDGKRCIREVEYREYRFWETCGMPIPAKIRLLNRRWHYRLDIELLKIHPSPGEEAFRVR